MSDELFLVATVDDAGNIVLGEGERELAKKFSGMKIISRIYKWTARRSLAANGYYFGVLVKSLCDYSGYRKKEMHAILKQKFAWEFAYIVNEKTGEMFEEKVGMSTRTMTKARFAQFIDDVEAFANELNCIIPPYSGDKYEHYQALDDAIED